MSPCRMAVVLALAFAGVGTTARAEDVTQLIATLERAADKRAVVARIAALGPSARMAAPALLPLLESSRPLPLRLTCIEALARLDARAPEVLAALRACLEDPAQEIQAAAAVALWVLAAPPDAVAHLLAIVRPGPRPPDPAGVLRVLAALRTGSLPWDPFRPALAPLLRHEHAAVRRAAVATLADEPEAGEEALAGALRSTDADVRHRAAIALRAVRGLAPETIRALCGALAEAPPKVRVAAAAATRPPRACPTPRSRPRSAARCAIRTPSCARGPRADSPPIRGGESGPCANSARRQPGPRPGRGASRCPGSRPVRSKKTAGVWSPHSRTRTSACATRP